MMARGDVVDRLCQGATEGMVKVAKAEQEISTSDVFSAYMTLAQRAIIYFRDAGGDPKALRLAIEHIWKEIQPETVH